MSCLCRLDIWERKKSGARRKVIVNLVLLPLVLIGLVIGGLVSVALPLLVVVGIQIIDSDFDKEIRKAQEERR